MHLFTFFCGQVLETFKCCKTLKTWIFIFVEIINNFYYYFAFQDESKTLDSISNIPCKLPEPVQKLIRLLFDVESMKKVMYEFEVSYHNKLIYCKGLKPKSMVILTKTSLIIR